MSNMIEVIVIKSSIPMSFGDKRGSDFSFSKQTGNSLYECSLHWHDCFEIITVRDKSMTALEPVHTNIASISIEK